PRRRKRTGSFRDETGRDPPVHGRGGSAARAALRGNPTGCGRVTRRESRAERPSRLVPSPAPREREGPAPRAREGEGRRQIAQQPHNAHHHPHTPPPPPRG